MNKPITTRRMFLGQLATTAGTWAAAGSLCAAEQGARNVASVPGSHPVRLGGPVFGAPQDPEGMALAHRRLGYRAAYCPGVSLGDKDRIREIRRAFAKQGVMIAEVGRWCNLLEADPAKRSANLKNVTEGLALAEEVGARCCVDIAGSFNRKVWFGPDPENLSDRFFDAIVENARKIIDAVRPKSAKFTYEVMGWALPDSPDAYVRLIKAVDRPAFGVHLDPCNLVNSPAKFYHITELLNECFDKLGPWIVSCHAKDVTWDVEMQVHFREVALGKGSLDYATYLRRLASLPADVPLMLEHMSGPAEYDQCRKYLFDLGDKIGVQFNDS